MPNPNHYASLYLSLIPEVIRKSISAGELNDRIAEAARLSGQAADPALSPTLRRAAKMRAQAVLRAQPRQHTERQHQALIAKAAAALDPWQADAIRRTASRLIEEEQPIAPRRSAAIAKAKADAEDDPVPVFDANGNLIGICDPGDLQSVSGAGGKKADDATAQQVAKAAGKVLVWDQWHRPYVAARRSVRENVRSPAVKARRASAPVRPAGSVRLLRDLPPRNAR